MATETTAVLRLLVREEVTTAMAKARQELDKFRQNADSAGKATNSLFKQITLGNLAANAIMRGLSEVGQMAKFAFTAPIANARSFETVLARISSVMEGDSTQAVQKLGKEILELSKVIPKSKEELGAGLYQIMQSGIEDAADAMQVLRVSAQAAVGGVTDMSTASKVLTDTINAYGMSAKDAQGLADVMFVGARMGTAEFADLAGSLGTVNSPAALLGVSVNEVVAATEAMSLAGIDAQTATTSLNRLLLSVVNPSNDVRDAVKEINKQYAGFAFSADALKSKGLQGFMKDLSHVVGDNQELMVKLTGDVRAFRAASVIAGTGTENFNKILEATKNSAGALREAFIKNADTVDNLLVVAWNSFIAVITEAGQEHLPEMKESIHGVIASLEANKDAIYEAASALSENLVGAMQAVVQNGPEIIQTLSAIAEVTATVIGAIGKVSGMAYKGVVGAGEGVANIAAGIGGTIIPGAMGDDLYALSEDITRAHASGKLYTAQVKEQTQALAGLNAETNKNLDLSEGNMRRQLDLRAGIKGVGDAAKGAADPLKKHGSGVGGLSKASEEGAKKQKELKKSMEEVGKTYQDVSKDISQDLRQLDLDHQKNMDSMKERIDGVKKSMEDLETSYKRTQRNLDQDEVDSVASAQDHLKDLRKELKDTELQAYRENREGSISVETNDKLTELRGEIAAAEGALAALSPDLLAKGASEAGKTDLQRDMEKIAQRRADEKADHDSRLTNLQEEMTKLEDKKRLDEAVYQNLRQQYVDTGIALTIFHADYTIKMQDLKAVTEDTAKSLAESLEAIRGSISKVDAEVGGSSEIGGRISERREQRVQERASGGYASGLTLVGEEGPELVSLPGGSYVHNNRDTRRMTGGVSITIQSIQVYKEVDVEAALARAARKIQLQMQGSS